MPTIRSSKGGRPARVYDPAQERQKALEQLRQELRHQRAENNTLQASRLFREFRLIAEQQGNSSAERSSSTQLDARARAGADSGISSSNHQTDGSKPAAGGPATQENRLSEGIWSTAGQPYSCLGRPEEVQSVLPPLSVDKQRRKPAKRKVPKAQTFSARDSGLASGRGPISEAPDADSSGAQILSAAQKRPMKPGPMDRADQAFPISSIAIAEFRRRQMQTAAAMFMNVGDAQADAANPKTWGTPVQAGQHASSPPRLASPGKSKPPTPRSPEAHGKPLLQDAEGRLASRSSLPGGQGSGTMVLRLPTGPHASGRPSRNISAMPTARGSLMTPPQAWKADESPGRSRLGTPQAADQGAVQNQQALVVTRRSQSPITAGSGTELVPRAGWGPLTDNAANPSRLHTPNLQRPSLIRPEEPMERTVQSVEQLQKTIWAAHRGKGGKDLQGILTCLPSVPKQPPTFPLLCPAFQAAPGDDSPACRWRNTFLQARQRQRKKLQMALWQRSQQRADARSRTGLASAACALLTNQFQHQGRKSAASPSHGRPAVSKLSEARGSLDLAALMAMQRPPSELTQEEQAEMDMLEAFYRQLCRFAYAIKALDPICMALIYEVKVLLESGQAITRGLLVRSLDALAWYATGMGMQSTCNGRLLLLLRFLARIVGLEEPELIQHARQVGILRMVYSAAEIGAMETAMYRASSGLSMLSSSSQNPNIRGLRFDL